MNKMLLQYCALLEQAAEYSVGIQVSVDGGFLLLPGWLPANLFLQYAAADG
jgi:hypothetical protein